MNKKVNRTGASLRISNDVLTKIAEVAATEIRGVASEGEHLVVSDKNMAQITGKLMPSSPVKAVLKNDSVEVTVNIVVLQGFKAEKCSTVGSGERKVRYTEHGRNFRIKG